MEWLSSILMCFLMTWLPWPTDQQSGSQILNPPTFNLAENRRINASYTCGEGVNEPEMYCKLVGANWADTINTHIHNVSSFPTVD